MKSHVPFCLLLSLALACVSCKRASGEPSAEPTPDAGSETKSDRATGQPDDAAWRRERSLDPFYERVAEDLRTGKPLIVAAYYGMWFQNENQPEKNLNWGMRFGHATMMRRADSDDHIAKHYEQTDWELVLEQKRDRSPIRTLVFESEIAPNDRWREEDVVEPFTTYLVMQAFPSREEAGLAMVENLRRGTARTLEIGDGQQIDLADAQAVGYFGHNFFYDYPEYDWDGFERVDGRPDRVRGLFAVGCKTARVPGFPALVGENVSLLLASRSLMASEGYTTLALLDGLARRLPSRQLVDLADETYKYFQHLTKPDRDIGDLFVSHGYRMYPDG